MSMYTPQIREVAVSNLAALKDSSVVFLKDIHATVFSPMMSCLSLTNVQSLFYIGAEGALVNHWKWQEVAQSLDILYLCKNILLSSSFIMSKCFFFP